MSVERIGIPMKVKDSFIWNIVIKDLVELLSDTTNVFSIF